MTLWIDRGADWELTGYAIRDLKKLCPDPNLAFDIGPAENGRIPSGEVKYAEVSVDTIGCSAVHGLVKSKTAVVLKPRFAGFIVQIGGEKRRLNEFTAFTHWPGLPSLSPPPASISVVYDPTDDAKRGYWVEDADGKKIAEPPDVILMHEFGHVEQALTLTLDPGDSETYPISKENAYRQSIGLPMRHGYNGGTGLRSSSGCFIATAAYGSEIDPQVKLLRGFRDDVLRQTRAGSEFFDEYWRHYYRVSPEIVRLMEQDGDLREMVRWSLVAPIVGFLRMAMEFPDAAIEDAPEPWRGFLLRARNEFGAWSSHIEMPRNFSGLPVEEAAEEIRIALAHLCWSPADRDRYLDELADRGELPLSVTGRRRKSIELLLRRDGRSEREINSVLGVETTEAAA